MTIVTSITAIGALSENVSIWKNPSGVLMSPPPAMAINASGKSSAIEVRLSSIAR